MTSEKKFALLSVPLMVGIAVLVIILIIGWAVLG